MKHDLNNSPSYEHMMGKVKPAHEGSQSHLGSSGTPASHNNIGGAGSMSDIGDKFSDGDDKIKNTSGKKLPEKSSVSSLDYADE